MRLWQRDLDAMVEAGRSPLSSGQLARLLGFSSRKKASERLQLLFRAGVLKRVGFFHPARQGRSEFVYYTGGRPHPRSLAHTLAVGWVRVQVAEWLRAMPGFRADFLYGHEVQMSAGIIPDATVIVRKGDKTALVFVEVDLGTEPVTSVGGYSLAGKLASYASYFDSGAYLQDVGWAGVLRGFRVALIIPQSRLLAVRHLVARDGHDFVLVGTSSLLEANFFGRSWWSADGSVVDVLGRGEHVGDLVGDQVGPPIPPALGGTRAGGSTSVPHVGGLLGEEARGGR